MVVASRNRRVLFSPTHIKLRKALSLSNLGVHLGNEKLRIGCFRGAATSQLHDDSEGPTGHANKFPATGPKAGQNQTGHPGACVVNAFLPTISRPSEE